VDGVPLDVHAEDVAGARDGLVRALGQLDAAGLAPAADLHLRLDDHAATEPVGDLPGLLRGGGDPAGEHGQAVPLEQVAPLVLVQVHVHESLVFATRPRAAVGVWPQPSDAAPGSPPAGARCALPHSRRRRPHSVHP
jgi:hypothetical protein